MKLLWIIYCLFQCWNDFFFKIQSDNKFAIKWNLNFIITFSLMLLSMSQPHFWKSGRMNFTLPKWGLGSSSGLSKLQNSISGGQKTSHWGVFFISLEIYRNVDVKNGLTWAIWTFVAQVMTKRKVGSQTDSLILDH